MSMPNIPDIDIDRDNAVNIVIISIGMQELGLAHIINAEGEKIQSFLGTLEGQKINDDIELDELIKLDESVADTLNAICMQELALLMKLQEAKKILELEKVHPKPPVIE